LKDEEEEVNDVKIEVERCKDVLLRVEGVLVAASHHQLRVEDDVAREDEGADGSVDNRQDLVADKDADNADNHEAEETDLKY